MIFHGIVFNVFLATVYMIIAVIAHTALGYLVILASKDFMAMLIKYMGVVLLLVAPSIILILNVIPSNFSFLAIVSPVYASQLLINSIFQSTDLWQIILAFAWLLLIGGILYPFVIKKQYQRYAMGN